MEDLLTAVKDFMIVLKKEIIADDERFEDDIKEAKVHEMVRNKHNNQLVMFHKQRVKMEAIEEQYRLKYEKTPLQIKNYDGFYEEATFNSKNYVSRKGKQMGQPREEIKTELSPLA